MMFTRRLFAVSTLCEFLLKSERDTSAPFKIEPDGALCRLEDDLYDNGLYHIHTPDQYSKKGICAWIDDVYDLGLNIEHVKATNIMGTNIEDGEHLNRTLGSIYSLSKELDIPKLRQQIREQKQWHESQL